MKLKEISGNFKDTILPGVLNSYSVVFFLQNKLMAIILLISTFINFYAGISGLYAVVVALIIGNTMHLDKMTLRSGIYTFNTLLTGIGMGTYFDFSIVFFSLLTLAAIVSLFFSVALSGFFYQYKLPVLSIPFVITMWFILLPATQFQNLGLTQRNIFWINELYTSGGYAALKIYQWVEAFPLPKSIDLYLRALSSIIFQNNLLSGVLIALGLLMSSRIFFSLSIIGFTSAYFFAMYTGSEALSLTYYNIGANYMMVALAVGGFFIIPSKHSYLWTILLVPITSLILVSFTRLFGFLYLPVYSLPFSVVVIIFIYFLQMRTRPNGLVFTPIQYYSPESNLYMYKNNRSRLSGLLYYQLQLPFLGEWYVSQGYDGAYTHLNEWGKALDFKIKDENDKTFRSNGAICEDYYCYGKPVLAAGDGVVEFVNCSLPDNEPGTVDTLNNWGNTIIIRHLNGLYTQISHLKKDSAKFKVGDIVKAGDIVASCGNSGRSPEPHIHFQVQFSNIVGAKTAEYPLSSFFNHIENKNKLRLFAIPSENSVISNTTYNALLQKSFDILPDVNLIFSYQNKMGEDILEQWESFTDANNYKYLYCSKTNSYAYYTVNKQMFNFTAFYGNKKSLLYYFYLLAYKVALFDTEENTIKDTFPLHEIINNKFQTTLHDFVAPFADLIKAEYSAIQNKTENYLNEDNITIEADIQINNLGKYKAFGSGKIFITKEKGIAGFEFLIENEKLQVTCLKNHCFQ
jgi:urea transporter/murein DD-endopeptidase MepM/ murein hydrolase activator NlpD